MTPIEKSTCKDIPCANTLHGEAPVSETINNPSPNPNNVNPKHKKRKVEIFGLKFRGLSELHETFGIFFKDKNMFLIGIYYFIIKIYMKKSIYILIFIFITFKAQSHENHYKNISKIEMDVLRNDQVIGYSNYSFTHSENEMSVTNDTQFEVELFGVKIFSIISKSIEKYENDKLVFFKSNTLQNNKKKFVDLKYEKNTNNFLIYGSSYKGTASLDNIIGNWWNHEILQSDSQISPLSGSIKEQVITFVGKEKINLYEKEYFTHRFKLKSKDLSLPEEKKLDFDIWFEPKKNLILKVGYNKMGYWEYKLKNLK